MSFDGESFLTVAILISKLLCLSALALALSRMIKGPTPFDRVVALDLFGGISLCVIVLLAISFEQKVLMDSAYAIAVVSFIGTVALAGFLGRGGEP